MLMRNDTLGEEMTARMNRSRFTESVVEDAALAWLEGLGWTVKHGPDIAPRELGAERHHYSELVLAERLRQALARLNPTLPREALDDAFRKLVRPEGPTLEARNRSLHRLIVDGVTVEYRRPDGSNAGAQARVVDFDDPENDDWLAVNQFTVVENKHTRRPDVVLFLNGLPVVLLELKNAGDENATIWSAFNQCQTYKAEVPALFAYNALLVVSDGVEARLGTLTGGREWFKPWRTIAGAELADAQTSELQVMLQGAFEAAQVLEELIALAKDMREADARGEALGLTEDELAFYDALEANDSAVKVLGDETLRGIARELVATVRANVTIDWTLRETVRAHLRVLVKRILRKHGYPPDKQEKATQTVLEQAEILSQEWATA